MIKAIAGKNVILGIDAENVRRLQEDKPILVKGDELGIDNDIYIIYGKTLHEVMQKIVREEPAEAGYQGG